MGHWLSYSITATSESDSSVTLRLQVIYHSTDGVSDSSNTLTVGGDWPAFAGSVAVNIPFNGGSQVIYDQSQVFSKAYGASASKSFSASLAGINYWGTTVSTSGSTTIPARPYSAPVAPSNVTVSRVSDSQHTVAWTNNSTGGTGTSAPYLSQRVQRWDNVGGSWVTIADGLSGSVSSFTDNTTVANRRYEYRVVAVNTTASTTSSASSAVQTTPAAPLSVSAVRSGTDVVVTFIEGQSSGMVVEFEVYDKPDGGARVLLATVASGLGSYTHSSPNAAETHQYEVRAKSTAGSTLYSGYVASSVVQLLAPPNAPTGLSPNGVAVDAGEDATLAWTHNPVDTTAQTKFEIRHRKAGDAWTTESAVTSASSSWSLAASTYAVGDTVEWQVRTWGEHADPSGWSETAVVHFSVRPTATINVPSGDVHAASLTTEWVFFSAAGATQAAYRARLLQGGVVVETVSGSGAATGATFARRLGDGEMYTVTVELQDSSGLWSNADSVTFDVAYLPPAAVALDVTFDEVTGRAYIAATPEAPVEGVTDTIDRIDIQRSIDGGEWVTIIHSAPPTVVTFDALPHTRGSNTYRAVSYSPIGASAIGPTTTVDVLSEYSYLNWGAGRGEVARLLVGQTLSEKSSREHTLVRFASATLPTLLMGRAVSRVLSVSAATVEGYTSTPAELHEASVGGTTVAWRDATGRRIDRGALSGMSDSSSWAPLSSVAFDITHIA